MFVHLKKSYDKPRQWIKKQRHHFTDKHPSSQSYGFSSSRAWMWELGHKESWVPRNWCFWIVVLKTLESILNSKEIKPVNPKGPQLWIFIGRNDAEVEAPILWPPDAKSWLVGKYMMLGKIEDRKRRGDTGWDGWMASPTQWTWVWANLEDGEGQGGLACCSPWGHGELDMTERLNNKQGPPGVIQKDCLR